MDKNLNASLPAGVSLFDYRLNVRRVYLHARQSSFCSNIPSETLAHMRAVLLGDVAPPHVTKALHDLRLVKDAIAAGAVVSKQIQDMTGEDQRVRSLSDIVDGMIKTLEGE